MRRTSKAAITGIAGVLLFGASSIGVSGANTLGQFEGDSVKIRSSPDVNSAQVYGLGYLNQKSCVYKKVTGGYANGINTWYYNKDLTTGVHAGYSLTPYIDPTYYGTSC